MLKRSSLLAFTVIALSASPDALQAAERRYSINDFDEVRVVGSHVVDIQIARGTAVSATGDAQALDGITVETQGRTLVIQSIQSSLSTWTQSAKGAVRVQVTVPQIKTVRVEGGGSVNVAELRGPQTYASVAGSGGITVARVNSDRAFIRLAGSGRLTLSGSVKNLEINAKGPGDVSAEQLAASDIKVVTAGSGRVTAQASRSADVTQNGAGEIVVTGKPACTVQNLGTGTVTCGE